MKKGIFITLEGPEGSGKSTHCALLVDSLKKQGYSVVQTREPGGTALAEALRRVLLDPQNSIAPLTELFLYEASRAQHTIDVILPALRAGKIVVCDRYTDATLAYQGYGRKLDTKIIDQLNRIATQGCVPDLTIVFDIPVEKGLPIARKLNKDLFATSDRLERETITLHRRVRRGYLALAKKEPRRVKMISTAGTIEETRGKVADIIGKIIKFS